MNKKESNNLNKLILKTKKRNLFMNGEEQRLRVPLNVAGMLSRWISAPTSTICRKA